MSKRRRLTANFKRHPKTICEKKQMSVRVTFRLSNAMHHPYNNLNKEIVYGQG